MISKSIKERIAIIRRLEAYVKASFVPPDFERLELLEHVAKETSPITIGAEIEVRFSSYFPRHFEKLKRGELPDNDPGLAKLQEELLRILNHVTELGIPKGKDKWWEFALLPAHHPYTIITEIDLLRKRDLIPSNQAHSLHLTIGGLEQSKDVGLLLMMLEVLGMSSPERIRQVADPDRSVTWARRGRAGMRQRPPEQLGLGQSVGVELRSLELPISPLESSYLITLAWECANMIHDDKPEWQKIVKELYKLAEIHNLDIDKNWGKPYDNPALWLHFADQLEIMDVTDLMDTIENLYGD